METNGQLDQNTRERIVASAAVRFLANLEIMTSYGAKLDYMRGILRQYDDLHLVALEFAVGMPPDPASVSAPAAGSAHVKPEQNIRIRIDENTVVTGTDFIPTDDFFGVGNANINGVRYTVCESEHEDKTYLLQSNDFIRYKERNKPFNLADEFIKDSNGGSSMDRAIMRDLEQS